MAPVEKTSLSIVRCSSQDSANRCENILMTGNEKKWLSNSEDEGRCIEAEIHISKAIKIGYINIANAGSAIVELLVGSSMWPSGKKYVTLLPAMMLLSSADSKSGKNNYAVRMLDNAQFTKGVPDGEWDRLQVICRQPFTKDKFGLKFIDIIEDDKLTSQKKTSPESERSKMTLEKFRRKLEGSRSPSSPSEPPPSPSLTGLLASPTSSRSACLVQASLSKLGKGHVKQNRVFLDKINQQHQRHTNAPKRHAPYPVDAQLQSQRRKSLTRQAAGDIEDEVECFLEAHNFDEMSLEEFTYKNLLDEMEKIRGCKLTKQEKKIFIRLAEKAVDDVVDRQKMQAEQPAAEDNWVEEYERDTVENQVMEVELEESIFNNATLDTSSSQKRRKTSQPSTSPPLSITPPPQFPTPPPKSNPAAHKPSALHECPICGEFFSETVIQMHASACVAYVASPTRDNDITEIVEVNKLYSPAKPSSRGDVISSDSVRCPMCDCWFPASRIQVHANVCAEAGREVHAIE